jgi:hypothetical protein
MVVLPLPMPPAPPPTEASETSPPRGEEGSSAPQRTSETTQKEAKTWRVGDRVCLQRTPRYLKTADPMPMLRPPDLVGIDEVGMVVGLRALGQLAVRFRRGTFLVEADAVSPVSETDLSEIKGSDSEGSGSGGSEGAQG